MTASLTPAQQAARLVDTLGPEALARAQAYTTGNHWVLLVDVLVAVLVAWLMVRLRLLDRIAARLEGRGRFLGSFTVAAAFLMFSSLLALPWTIYPTGGASGPTAFPASRSATSSARRRSPRRSAWWRAGCSSPASMR